MMPACVKIVVAVLQASTRAVAEVACKELRVSSHST